MFTKLFRVWCKDYGEWEQDQCFLDEYGNIIMYKNNDFIRVTPYNHILEMNTGYLDRNKNPIFVGDIVRVEDGNAGYGRLRDVYFDGYEYFVIRDWYKSQISGDYSINYDENTILEVVGNIHTTKLTDSMKYWIDPEWREEFQKTHGGVNRVW